jgi:Domain of unknown function (DUF2703)
MTTPATTTPTRTLEIEFLFLDLDTCTRCRATDATLLAAIERTRPALEAAGVAVTITKILVASEAQAQALGFVSSPTIRINGVDIAGELVESACDSCSETCACNGGVDCRDWLWRGERSHEPPLGLIVEAIMGHAGGPDPASPPMSAPSSATVPANLRQYFAATGAESACCGNNERPGTLQAMGGSEFSDGLSAGGTVDVQDVEAVPTGEADVGLGMAGPPGEDPGPVTGGVLDPVRYESAEGVLGGLPAARIPTGAASSGRRGLVAGDRLEAAVVGEGIVQGQDGDAAGGIAKGGIAQPPAGPTHGLCSSASGRWRCRKLAALLRPQPAASARLRAVQARPSGRGWA